MKINMLDIPKIVEDLRFIQFWDPNITGEDVLDYAIEKSIIGNKELVQILDDLKSLLVNGKGIDEVNEIAKRDILLKRDELANVYRNLRCIANVRYSKGESFSIDEAGFSKELTKALNKNNVFKNNMVNLVNNLDSNLLQEFINNDKDLEVEFDRQIQKLGFCWFFNGKSVKLKYNYSIYNAIKNSENDYYIFETSHIKCNKKIKDEVTKEDKQRDLKLQSNPVLEKPFASSAFNAMPKEFQEWMKIGFMQDTLQQAKTKNSFEYSKPRRFISQMIESEEKVDRKFVEIKSKKPQRKTIKKAEILEQVKEDLDTIFDLDENFIIKNQVTLWNFIKHSNEEPLKKCELLVHIHDVCTSKVDLKV